MRSLIKESIRHMGLLVDFVNSVEEAEEFCRDALPHAIVFESVLANDRFQKLRLGISIDMPSFVFIEVAPEGSALQLSTNNAADQRAHRPRRGDAVAAVGADLRTVAHGLSARRPLQRPPKTALQDRAAGAHRIGADLASPPGRSSGTGRPAPCA